MNFSYLSNKLSNALASIFQISSSLQSKFFLSKNSSGPKNPTISFYPYYYYYYCDLFKKLNIFIFLIFILDLTIIKKKQIKIILNIDFNFQFFVRLSILSIFFYAIPYPQYFSLKNLRLVWHFKWDSLSSNLYFQLLLQKRDF